LEPLFSRTEIPNPLRFTLTFTAMGKQQPPLVIVYREGLWTTPRWGPQIKTQAQRNIHPYRDGRQ